MATVIAAARRAFVKRTPVVKPDELVDVLVLTLGPAEELLPVKERVAATMEVALQFGDNSVDIVVGLSVQSSSLPKDCPVRVQRGAEETLAGREGLDAAHGSSEGQVVGPAGAPVRERRQITVLGTGEDEDIHLPGSGGCYAGSE